MSMAYKVTMKKVEHKDYEVFSNNHKDACESAEKHNPGFKAESVEFVDDDKSLDVEARCEACGCPVFEDSKYLYLTDDAVSFCDEHGKALRDDVKASN